MVKDEKLKIALARYIQKEGESVTDKQIHIANTHTDVQTSCTDNRNG